MRKIVAMLAVFALTSVAYAQEGTEDDPAEKMSISKTLNVAEAPVLAPVAQPELAIATCDYAAAPAQDVHVAFVNVNRNHTVVIVERRCGIWISCPSSIEATGTNSDGTSRHLNLNKRC